MTPDLDAIVELRKAAEDNDRMTFYEACYAFDFDALQSRLAALEGAQSTATLAHRIERAVAASPVARTTWQDVWEHAVAIAENYRNMPVSYVSPTEPVLEGAQSLWVELYSAACLALAYLNDPDGLDGPRESFRQGLRDAVHAVALGPMAPVLQAEARGYALVTPRPAGDLPLRRWTAGKWTEDHDR